MKDEDVESIFHQIIAEIDRQKDVESTLLAVRYCDTLAAMAEGVDEEFPGRKVALGWLKQRREALVLTLTQK